MPVKDTKKYMRAWFKAHPDKLPAYMRKLNLSKRGLTVDDYDQMLAAQGGVCLICRKPETHIGSHGKVQRLAVDHDHAHPDAEHPDLPRRRASVRGLLCRKCNYCLAGLNDDPACFERAAAYLRRSIPPIPDAL